MGNKRFLLLCMLLFLVRKCLFTTAHQTLDKYKITVQNVATVSRKVYHAYAMAAKELKFV